MTHVVFELCVSCDSLHLLEGANSYPFWKTKQMPWVWLAVPDKASLLPSKILAYAFAYWHLYLVPPPPLQSQSSKYPWEKDIWVLKIIPAYSFWRQHGMINLSKRPISIKSWFSYLWVVRPWDMALLIGVHCLFFKFGDYSTNNWQVDYVSSLWDFFQLYPHSVGTSFSLCFIYISTLLLKS